LIKDEYEDNEDVGFDLYEVGQSEFQRVASKIAIEFDFPNRAVAYGQKSNPLQSPILTKPFIYIEPQIYHREYYPKHLYKEEEDNNGNNNDILKDLKKRNKFEKMTGKGNLSGDFGGSKDKKNDSKKPKAYNLLPEHLKHPPTDD
jgi:hypothetical protein